MARQATAFNGNNKNQMMNCGKNCLKKQQKNALRQNNSNSNIERMFQYSLAPWRLADSENQWLEPNIEVTENQNSIMVSAELPGMNPEDIQVNVSQDGYLTISGEKTHHREENNEQNGTYFSERSYGMIQRTIPLPTDLNYEATEADFENGVLSVNIPKTEAASRKVKKVAVRSK